ncbi:MAG: hypothetical protein U0183_22985 [Polyangiaceae bacterium]
MRHDTRPRGIALALAFVVGGALVARPALAHSLDVATARLTLRDEHADVLAELDPFLATGVPPTELATAPDDAVDAFSTKLRLVLERGVRFEAGGTRLPVVVKGTPGRDELRAKAAVLSAKGEVHGDFVVLRLDVEGRVRSDARVNVSFPPELGPVLVTLVRPEMRYSTPGMVAGFDAPRAGPHDEVPTAAPPAGPLTSHHAPLTLGAGVLASLVLVLAQRRAGKVAHP